MRAGRPARRSVRLTQALDKFADAEDALPDFAEYDRLQREALAELQTLLSEIESAQQGQDDGDEPAA